MTSPLTLHERLSRQAAILGVMQLYPSLVFAELAALCGYDFIVLDCEHGLLDDLDIYRTAQAVASTGMAVFVRPRGHDGQTLGRLMDMGVDGFLVPSVATAEQAAKLVRALDYPPHGDRGFAASSQRASGFGLALEAHKAAPRQRAFLAVLIESRVAVSNVDAILAVDGVDAAVIGPSDLSADLGALGDFGAPAFQAAYERLERAAEKNSKLTGAAPHAGQQLEALMARGHRLFLIGSDAGLMREAMIAQLATARASMAAHESP